MAARRADYFAAGTLVVWDLDVLREHVVLVYWFSDPTTPDLRRCGEIADAEPALPGWSMSTVYCPPATGRRPPEGGRMYRQA